MPKVKTYSLDKKKLIITASGKIKRNRCGLRHMLDKKRTSRKRRLSCKGNVAKCDLPRIKQLINM